MGPGKVGLDGFSDNVLSERRNESIGKYHLSHECISAKYQAPKRSMHGITLPSDSQFQGVIVVVNAIETVQRKASPDGSSAINSEARRKAHP
jgi:hypothetical protein